MTKKTQVIELNGKRYDARTGVLLAGGVSHSQPRTDARRRTARAVDSFVRAVSEPLAAPAPQTAPLTDDPGPRRVVMDVMRPGAHQLQHHAPKKSQTLMRSTVKKPAAGSLKRHTKSQTHTHALVRQPAVAIIPKLSHPNVDVSRARRAQRIGRSELIRRYAEPQVLPKGALQLKVQEIKPVHASTPAAHVVAAPHPAASSMDVFERALRHANSHHEQPVAKAKHRKHAARVGKRALSLGAAGLAVVLLLGFIAFQNQANLTMHYASYKAGFSAMLPSYKPSGFAVGKFSYSPGIVAVNFHNDASGQSYNLVQQSSNWDSTALRDNYVALSGSNYSAIEAAGRTIYTYGDNNASWVNGGVWYRVTSNGTLSTSQLVNLATSM